MSALLIMISGVSSGDEIAVLLRSNPYGKAVAMHTLEVYVKTCIIFLFFGFVLTAWGYRQDIGKVITID